MPPSTSMASAAAHQIELVASTPTATTVRIAASKPLITDYWTAPVPIPTWMLNSDASLFASQTVFSGTLSTSFPLFTSTPSPYPGWNGGGNSGPNYWISHDSGTTKGMIAIAVVAVVAFLAICIFAILSIYRQRTKGRREERRIVQDMDGMFREGVFVGRMGAVDEPEQESSRQYGALARLSHLVPFRGFKYTNNQTQSTLQSSATTESVLSGFSGGSSYRKSLMNRHSKKESIHLATLSRPSPPRRSLSHRYSQTTSRADTLIMETDPLSEVYRPQPDNRPSTSKVPEYIPHQRTRRLPMDDDDLIASSIHRDQYSMGFYMGKTKYVDAPDIVPSPGPPTQSEDDRASVKSSVLDFQVW
ncbi:hypothetical protein BZG36_05146 [Bifiguratus adelaidae]|uniref:Uncharacterized protein n=1 Tax=Bifiguratus adelaidae TaxID=1938954 RepID=A0A261XU16_9FUNG|nr:hypothetical protein BZG36_05146 [Bifiguratus adelaidae]